MIWTSSGRFLAGPCRPAGSEGFMLLPLSVLHSAPLILLESLHLDLDTEDTLSEENVSNGVVNEVTSGLTRVDHEALSELHRLGTSSTELAGNDNLTTLSTRLHDESEDTVTGSEKDTIVSGQSKNSEQPSRIPTVA